jgi:carbamoyl-phosphate synthase large subunit
MAGVTVLVTGAGALVGQGVLRSLRMAGCSHRIVTTDPDHRAAGHWLGDCAYTIPLASDPAFVARIEDIIAREAASVVLIGTDVELAPLARERCRLEATYDVRIVVSTPRVVKITDDKWLTARFLRDHGFPYARSAPTADRAAVRRLVDAVGLPVFVKPRRGARSVGCSVVTSVAALEALSEREPDYVVQELLPDDEGEFTAGCLVCDGRCVSVVVLRRDLRDGNTYRAYSEGPNHFEPALGEIVERLGVEGPCNLQFRVQGGEPVVFEINARFSGTTPIRAIFGFNEVEALLAHLVDGRPIPAPALRRGVVLRAMSDVFVETRDVEQFAGSGRLEQPRGEPVRFHPAG